jgi:uncharacterized FlaG/YvyC family protein
MMRKNEKTEEKINRICDSMDKLMKELEVMTSYGIIKEYRNGYITITIRKESDYDYYNRP